MNPVAIVGCGSSHDSLLVRLLAAVTGQPRIVLVIEPDPPTPQPAEITELIACGTLAPYLADDVLPCAPPPWTQLSPLGQLAPRWRVKPNLQPTRPPRWLRPPPREAG